MNDVDSGLLKVYSFYLYTNSKFIFSFPLDCSVHDRDRSESPVILSCIS